MAHQRTYTWRWILGTMVRSKSTRYFIPISDLQQNMISTNAEVLQKERHFQANIKHFDILLIIWLYTCEVETWCRFLILLVESWRTVVFSGTVHWLYLKTSFHPLLWTSSGLTGSWKLSAYIGFGSLRSVKVLKLMVRKPKEVLKVLNLMVIRCLRSLNVLNLIAWKMWKVLVVGLRSGRVLGNWQAKWQLTIKGDNGSWILN